VSQLEVAGRYRLEGRLGSGGMSTVHRALDTRLERLVAVKLLAEHLADDPTFVSRFQREAQAAARLVHPNIVQVFDSGLDEDTGQHYIVMEYIEGHSGAEILHHDGWMEVPDAMAMVEQACNGLDYAHRHGVVHRDVKPGNFMRSGEGVVKLADFGIAKATEQSSITQVGSVLGTAAYLAPEQAHGEEAGPPADIYALGVVTYQLMSGRLPYEANSLTELALKQQNEAPPTLDTLVAAVTPELADAVAIALSLNPHDRYQTALQMGQAMASAARGVAPSYATDATTVRGTSATSVLAADRGGTRQHELRPAAVARAPRRPRPGPPPRRAAPERVAQPARRGGLGRLVAALVVLLLIAAAVAAVVVASTPGTTTVKLRNVVYTDVQRSVQALNGLLSDNTR